MFPVAQAQQFFAGWHAARPLELSSGADIARMRAFFDAWKSNVSALAKSRPAETFDSKQFASFAEAFNTAYPAFRRRGVSANAWRAAGVGKDEMRNSGVVRWLLDRFEDHGQGPAILVALLQHLKLTELADLAAVHPYWTRVETCPFGEQESRIDIEVESPRF